MSAPRQLSRATRFNPRLPCGRRCESQNTSPGTSVFQSAPPVREAICESRPIRFAAPAVSIRASRAGGDERPVGTVVGRGVFQSAPPVREAIAVAAMPPT